MKPSEIEKHFFSLYSDLIKSTESVDYELCPFFMQWGNSYFETSRPRVLFVGKAVNGWVTKTRNVDEMFNLNNPKRIFAVDDQIEWVDKLSRANPKYNTNKSSFWKLIRRTTKLITNQDSLSSIAWSNLYKIAPYAGGNPNAKLRRMQFDVCCQILKKEIDVFEPTHVVFLTSGWERGFAKQLGLCLEKTETVEWDRYRTTYTIHKGTYYIFSQHPQGKKREPHAKALVDILSG